MNLTVKFEGHVAKVIDELMSRGIVATKTEALRLGVLNLEREYLKQDAERMFDGNAALDASSQDRLVAEGKMRLISQKEFEKMVKGKK